MTKDNRNITIVMIAAVLAICLCLGVIAVGGFGAFFYTVRTGVQSLVTEVAIGTVDIQNPTPVDSATPAPTPTQRSTPTPTATLKPGEPSPTPDRSTPTVVPTLDPAQSNVPADVAQQMDQIQQQVIQLRVLNSDHLIARMLINRDELAQKVENDFYQTSRQQDFTDSAAELYTVGLLPANFDLFNLYKSLQTEQVLGFYDSDTKGMYVVKETGFNGNEKFTYAHEYTHVLQDQNYDPHGKLGYNDAGCNKDSELCAGIQALMEGDATLLQTQWLKKYATQQDVKDIQAFYNSTTSPVFDSAPDFLKKDFTFPYDQGEQFVQALYNKGGWANVNNAYVTPPASTEQILHPDRYPDDKPIPVTLPPLTSTLGSGWRQAEDNTMGEWYLYLILADGDKKSARLSDATAQKATSGWGGDRYMVFVNATTHQDVLLLKAVWDTSNDAQQFADAFVQLSNKRFGGGQKAGNDTTTWSSNGGFTQFYFSGKTTIWIFAPDQATAQKVWDTVKP